MFKRVVLGIVGLVIAAGAPIAYFTTKDNWKKGGSQAAAGQTDGAVAWSSPGLLTPLPGPPPPLGSLLGSDGDQTQDLAEVLRFDVTPGWVTQRWPRVTTGLAQPQLVGYRVSLVTGTTPADLAGALTYYFNPEQHVQRITFRGTTGDVRRLVQILTTRYMFTRRLTNDPGVVLYEGLNAEGQPTNVMRIRAAWVVKANDPYRRFEIDLVMDQPKA